MKPSILDKHINRIHAGSVIEVTGIIIYVIHVGIKDENYSNPIDFPSYIFNDYKEDWLTFRELDYIRPEWVTDRQTQYLIVWKSLDGSKAKIWTIKKEEGRHLKNNVAI